ncbi:MAG: hypothetical protein MUF00_09300 [Gemmatimonadaceae bacterium]|nr:hypothetical protein [Gemmatimonadaceae bacterium]
MWLVALLCSITACTRSSEIASPYVGDENLAAVGIEGSTRLVRSFGGDSVEVQIELVNHSRSRAAVGVNGWRPIAVAIRLDRDTSVVFFEDSPYALQIGGAIFLEGGQRTTKTRRIAVRDLMSDAHRGERLRVFARLANSAFPLVDAGVITLP